MKNESIRKVINVDKPNYAPLFEFKELDNAVIRLSLFKDSVEFDITGQTVKLGAKTSKGLKEQSEGFTINKNNLDIDLKNSILVPGAVEIDLELKDVSGAMTTASFFITVKSKVLNNKAVESTNEFDTFTKTVAKVEEDYKGLRRIIIDENQAANLQDQVNQTNAHLETKANKNEVANGLRAKGKTTYSNLPSSNNNIGDYYYCTDGDGVNPPGNYVWNGTTWYFGGTGDDGYNKLNSIIEYTNIGMTKGYIVHSNGKVANYDTLNCSDFIGVLPMSKININLGDFNLNTPDARGLAFYDIDKKYVSGVQYQAGYPIPIIDIIVPENCYYLRFTYKNSPILTISTQLTNIVEKCLKVSKINTIDYTDLVKKSISVGAYINSTNGKFSLYNNTFSISEFIPCEENDEIMLTIPNKYSDSRGLAFYTENKEFISGVKYSNEEINVTVPTNAKYFAITVIEGFKLLYICNNKQIIRGIDILNPINYVGNEISIFTKCCCIGDSLTKGVFNANNTGTTEYVAIEKYGYPKRLQDSTGVECTNLGQGGHTTKSWYELYKNKDLTGYDMAIINLGANDTVGNNMSPGLTEEYLQKIVDKMKDSNKGIKIFLATILPAYYNRNTDLYYNINSKIKNVVSNNENCYLVDLSLFSKCRDNTPYAQGHLTALGYNQEANELKSIISHIIKNNMEDFKYTHFINSEHSFN